MTVLSPQEAMALYLYGTKTVPTDKLDPNLIELSVLPTTSVDVNQYMDSGAGRFVTAKDFDYVNTFFDPQFMTSLAPGTYTDQAVRAHFAGAAFITRYQSALTDGIDDQTERVFVWQTVAFEIDDGARFVIEPDTQLADGTIIAGRRYVENFRIIPYTSNDNKENFDFEGGVGNLDPFPYDPYGIGSYDNIGSNINGVEITLSGVRTATTLTQQLFSTLSTSSDSYGLSNQAYYAYGGGFDDLAKQLFDQGITKFIFDSKAIVYGYRGGGDVDASARINDFHEEAFENGIVFVGSNQSDTLSGVPDANSILYGNGGGDVLNGSDGDDELTGGSIGQQDDNAADILIGGSGFDIYYVGAADRIIDEDGKGAVFLGKTVLTGGKPVSEGSSIYKDAKGNLYEEQGGNLVITLKTGGTVTIEDWEQDKLGIHLGGGGGPPDDGGGDSGDLSNQPVSPLIIDLDDNGVQSTSLATSMTYFALDGDGIAERTAWVSPADGLLVLDRNANGMIDNQTELFGTKTSNGFTILAPLDENADGLITAADAAFANLRVWRDGNSDGKSTPEELLSLSELGIAEIVQQRSGLCTNINIALGRL